MNKILVRDHIEMLASAMGKDDQQMRGTKGIFTVYQYWFICNGTEYLVESTEDIDFTCGTYLLKGDVYAKTRRTVYLTNAEFEKMGEN